jgi:hypothetical protein
MEGVFMVRFFRISKACKGRKKALETKALMLFFVAELLDDVL